MKGIQKQAFLTIKIVVILSLGLGLAGWYGLHQTSMTINEFEADSLPEMSTALRLSESVARLAAFAPYVANSAKPFQLKSERKRLQSRFNDLEQVAQSLKKSEFRKDLLVRLSRLHLSTTELIEQIEKELFLREDLLSAQFVLRELENRDAERKDRESEKLNQYSLLRFLLNQESRPLAAQKALIEKFFPPSEATDKSSRTQNALAELANSVVSFRSQIQNINKRKAYLLALIRVQSEHLTNQVNIFVEKLQVDVEEQRKRIQSTVTDANFLMAIVALLLMFGMIRHYLFNHRMTRDLAAVTQDMLKLVEGNIHDNRVAVQREDEIGELARAYRVFRNYSIKVQEVSNDLTQQKELLETVFNHINDGLSVFSPEAKLLSWNQRFLEIFQLSETDVFVGQPLRALQSLMESEPFDYWTLTNEPVDIIEMNRLRHRFPQTFERRYHSGKIIEFRSQPMPDSGFVTLYSDLTDRKTIEAQLHQAQKMEVLGQLTSGVAHDFNNLLAAVLANLQLLHSSPGLNRKQNMYVERSLNVTEKGVALIQRLLAFSRKQQLHPKNLNVDGLIDGMIDLIVYSIPPNISIVKELNVNKSIHVDPSQLENAILNLAINSSAALPDGGKILIKTEHISVSDMNRDYIATTVEDDGCGISADIRDRVLEPFFTTKPAGQGSGLGLSTVYGFVSQSGGDLQIETSPGKGTKVTLLLPVADDCEMVEAKEVSTLNISVAAPKSKLIVLVEDNSYVRQVVQEQIESMGYKTLVFSNAESALDTLPQNAGRIGCVLTDISLTGTLSGVDLKDMILETWPEIPVIMTSGLPRDSLEQYYGLHFDDMVISKPTSFSTLKQILGS